MNLKKIAGLAVTTLALNISVLGHVSAASIDVKCETRSTTRSKVSVDGAGFVPGLYRAQVLSGTAVAWSKDFKRPIRGQVGFDFDSDAGDISQGATAIARTFIKNRSVTGRIYSYNSISRTYSLRASITESCTAK